MVNEDLIEGFISEQDVRRALDLMLDHGDSQRVPIALLSLTLVDELLVDPDLPSIENARVFALFEVFSNIITSQLRIHRAKLGIEQLVDEDTLEACRNHIVCDDSQHSTRLIAWSLLYYCYVRVDLNIDLETYASFISLTPRTIRRYRRYAVYLLTQALIHSERQARLLQRKRLLFAQLPQARPQNLLGRQPMLSALSNTFNTTPTPTIFVTGPPGIGKTSLVQTFIRNLIETAKDRTIDRLVWLNNPSSVAYLHHVLKQCTHTLNTKITLKEWLMLYHLIIVIDDAEHLLSSDAEQLEELLLQLEMATVILISSVYQPLMNIDLHMVVDPLDQAASLGLIIQTLQTELRVPTELSHESMSEIQHMCDGNPSFLQLMTRTRISGIQTTEVRRFLDQTFHLITEKEQRLWCCFALCPQETVRFEDIQLLWSGWFEHHHISSLLKTYVLELVDSEYQRYRLGTIAKHYVEQSFSSSQDVRRIVGELITHITDDITRHPLFALQIMNHLSSASWFKWDNNQLERWLTTLVEQESLLTEFAEWYAFWDQMVVHSVLLQHNTLLQHAIGLRHLARWQSAEELLNRVLRSAGQRGDFELQARCLIELSIIYRCYGQLGKAFSTLYGAQQIAERFRLTDLTFQCCLELAQVAIEAMDGQAALNYLQDSTGNQSQSIRAMLLMSEAYLLVGQVAKAQNILDRVLAISSDRAILGRIHDLRGRSFVAVQDLTSAKHEFALAVSYFEALKDSFALGRCLSNLGVVFIHLAETVRAMELLNRAVDIQRCIGDVVGASVTSHNLDLISD